MKHLCQNCIHCEMTGKVKGKLFTYCGKNFCKNPITNKVKYCNYHEKKYLTALEALEKSNFIIFKNFLFEDQQNY